MEERVYDFCPKCGALTLNGVCSNCGKRTGGKRSPKKKGKIPAYAIFAIVVFVFFIIGSFAGVFFAMVRNVSSLNGELSLSSESDEDFDSEEWISELDKDIDEAWEPEDTDTKVTFYEDFKDCMDDSVSYGIRKDSYIYKDVQYNTYVEISYVQIESDDFDTEYINNLLREEVASYQAMEADETAKENYADTNIYIESYVTYNDEEKLSVVTKESEFYVDEEEEELFYTEYDAINFDLKTGSLLFLNDYLTIDDAFVKDFVQKQMENASEQAKTFSQEEVKERLNSYEGVMFYTPQGLEVGFQYLDLETSTCGLVTETYENEEVLQYIK